VDRRLQRRLRNLLAMGSAPGPLDLCLRLTREVPTTSIDLAAAAGRELF
jgi:hypothetical protein